MKITNETYVECPNCGVIGRNVDEIHQLFVGSRSGQISDVLLDGCGVFFGGIVMLGLWKLVTFTSRRKNP